MPREKVTEEERIAAAKASKGRCQEEAARKRDGKPQRKRVLPSSRIVLYTRLNGKL